LVRKNFVLAARKLRTVNLLGGEWARGLEFQQCTSRILLTREKIEKKRKYSFNKSELYSLERKKNEKNLSAFVFIPFVDAFAAFFSGKG
jgi:hypothetical protein